VYILDDIELLKQKYHRILQSSHSVRLCCFENKEQKFWKEFCEEIIYQYTSQKKRKMDIFKSIKNQCAYGYFSDICPMKLTIDNINTLWVLFWLQYKIERFNRSRE